MEHTSLFNTLAKGTETVLDVADKAIDYVGLPLTFIWGALQTALIVGAGAALGPLPVPAVLALAAAGGTATAGLTYYGSHALTGLFRSSAENTAPAQPAPQKPDHHRAGFSFGGLAPA